MGKINLFYEDYSQFSQLSHTDLAYIQHDERLKEFYAYEPLEASIPLAIEGRKKNPVDRELLLRVLKKQYSALDRKLPIDDEVLLNENTFTITTSHQPTLFTGPLFHIYKIASVINLAEGLNERHPAYKFLPVFVMSGEDHDWQEVNHFHLFGKRHEWQREASGPCGRLSTQGLDLLINELAEILKNTHFGTQIHDRFTACLKAANNYGHFHRLLVASLFENHGLIVLDTDDRQLKEAFIPVFEQEIQEQFSYKHVPETQKKIEKQGFKVQAYCRQVNLFYMDEGTRERIDLDGNGYIRTESKIKYTPDEIISELHAHPERFSPNVILRPLYQEFILPNIAYVGGGGELAYWLERKTQFAYAGIHFPMLIRRNSVLILDSGIKNQLAKLGLEWKDMLKDINGIIKKYLRTHNEADLNYEAELKMIHEAYAQLASKAEKKDPTLAKAIIAEESKQIKQFEQLGSRLMRTEKQQQETQIKKIERIKEKLFPGGGLQERHENFLSFYSAEGPQWIDEMVRICDPWLEKFVLVEQSE